MSDYVVLVSVEMLLDAEVWHDYAMSSDGAVKHATSHRRKTVYYGPFGEAEAARYAEMVGGRVQALVAPVLVEGEETR